MICLPIVNICYGKDVGRDLVPLLPLVDLDNLLGVDGETLVGVHHHAEQPRVSLNIKTT